MCRIVLTLSSSMTSLLANYLSYGHSSSTLISLLSTFLEKRGEWFLGKKSLSELIGLILEMT